MKHARTILAVLVFAFALVFTPAPHLSFAAPAVQSAMRPRLVQVIADPNPSSLRIPAPPQFSTTRAPAATITIHPVSTGQWNDVCTTLPANAQTAFQYAANIWASVLTTNVPIDIDVCWASNLPSNVLGHAGPNNLLANFANRPVANTYYTVALANSYAGYDLDPSNSDIYIGFSSNFNWYYQTNGTPSGGQYDLVSVALHEIGHGLNFLGSMDVEDGSGVCGSPTGYGCYGYGNGSYPSIYDRFAQDASGNSLVNTSVYGNPSTSLGNTLRNAVYFSGANANAANGGRVKLYTPATWNPGSSYSHVDEIFNGTANALMTYAIASQEVIHAPGPVTLGMMKDLGWRTTTGCYTLTTNVSPAPAGTINKNPAPNCNNGTQYNDGTVVQLTASANGGYVFFGWAGDVSSTSNPVSVTMNTNKNITASFNSSSFVPQYRFLPFVYK